MARKEKSKAMPRSPTGERILPTGQCWCGCGSETTVGAFFLTGHDKRAVAHVITTVYGGVPEFLKAMGLCPGGEHWDKVKKPEST